MLRPSVDFSWFHMIRSDCWRRPSSSLPGSSTSSTEPADIVDAGPISEVGIVLVPALNPCSGEEPGVPLTSRFSQPTRSLEPGSASSISSIAAKCERLATGSPVACTAATLPASQSGSRSVIAGCSPNMPSLASSRSEGTAIRGRAA